MSIDAVLVFLLFTLNPVRWVIFFIITFEDELVFSIETDFMFKTHELMKEVIS